jgi:hypothetical protein
MVLSFRFWALFDYWIFPCKEGAHCTSCYVAVGFFLVLQNRTIGFEKGKGKSTKTDKTDKKLMGIKRDKSGKSSSQIVPRI